jgi:hypothetical protein
MPPQWWSSPPDDADLDYGFDSDNGDRFDPDFQRKKPETEDKGVLGNMASWLQRQAGSQSTQLATTAVLSGAAVAGAIFGYQAVRRKEAVHDLKASIPKLDEQHYAEKVRSHSSHATIQRLTDGLEAHTVWRGSLGCAIEQGGRTQHCFGAQGARRRLR